MDEAVVVVVVAIIAVALVDVALVGVVGGVGRPNGRREADPTAEGWTETAMKLGCRDQARDQTWRSNSGSTIELRKWVTSFDSLSSCPR